MPEENSRADYIRRLRRSARQPGTTPPDVGKPTTVGRWTHHVGTVATAITALAAVAALLFTGISSQQAQNELRYRGRELDIAQQGQVTDRYNAAVTNLGHHSQDVRMGGIYALQRILRDSPRDQPALVDLIAAYIRAHTPTIVNPAQKKVEHRTPANDVQAALTALAGRSSKHDGPQSLNLMGADIGSAYLPNAYFARAAMQNVNLYEAVMEGANFSHANLLWSNLDRAYLPKMDLHGAQLDIGSLRGAILPKGNLSHAHMPRAALRDADLSGANLREAVLRDTDLRGANFSAESFYLPHLKAADLTGALLTGADLRGADLTGADLTAADLSDADLRGADLTGADLTAAHLSNADLRDTHLTSAQLRQAKVYRGAQLPAPLRAAVPSSPHSTGERRS